LVRALSCRQIGSKSYISGDIRYECRTSQHNYYVGVLVVPSFILWMIFMPGILLYILVKNKNNLNSINMIIGYGFLYVDYKKYAFYWEFVKIFL
jgi:hypothetical protein